MKSNNIIRKFAEKARRENELSEYGRIMSLRPSQEHKSKVVYYRKRKHKGWEY